MKKFVFTLASVLKYKQTVEKKQRADLAAIVAILQKLYARDNELDEAFERCGVSLARVLREGLDIANELPRHDAYFLFIRDEKKLLAKKIEAAEREKHKCQQALIKTMNEIKTLENLREEQYERYMEEVRAEEAKDLSDLISFRVISGEQA